MKDKHAAQQLRRTPPQVELVGFVSGALKLRPGDKLPEELVVVPWGRTETNRGPVICDETTLAVFDLFQLERRRDHVMGDFNHASMPGKVPLGTPVKKAGKGLARVERGRGIVVSLRAEDGGYWTKAGQEHVGGGDYPDISPAIERDANGVVYGLHSWAHCEHGEMRAGELELFNAGGEPGVEHRTPNTKQKTMDYKTLLLTLLGLPDDASDEAITAATAGKSKAPEGMSAGGGNAQLAELTKQLTAFQATVTAKLDGFEAAEKKRQVSGLVEAAKAAGKEIKLDIATLEGMGAEAAGKYLDTLAPGAVPVSGAQQGNANAGKLKGPDAELDGFSAEELEEAKEQGLDPEKLKANFNKMTGAGKS